MVKNEMLGIIIVDFHSIIQTVKYVKDQLSLYSGESKIVIVINESNDEYLAILREALDCQVLLGSYILDRSKNIFIIPSPYNLGYAKGNNLGANFFISNFESKYLCICNNDLNFLGVDPFTPLIEKANTLKNVGIIGPKIVGLDNKDQSPHKYVSFLGKYLFRNIVTPFVNLFVKLSRFNTTVPFASEGYYYRLMGCFLIFDTKSFIECGMFDESTFLYGEESIISERMALIDKYCFFYPGVSIVHEHGKTISKFYKKKSRLLQEFRTDKYYYEKYRSSNKITFYAAFLSLKITFLFLSIKER